MLIICLLVSQIAAHLLVNAPKMPMNGNLPFLSIAQDNSRPQIDSTFPNKVKLQTFKNGADQEAGSLHESIKYYPNCKPSSLG